MLNKIVLVLILVFASVLYFYKIETIPNGFYVDETTIGYNAYSILTTSRDEFGKLFPIAFRFFGAYTPPLHVYMVVPIIKLFGLSIISVRALSIIFTLIGIIIVYLFVNNLKIYKTKNISLISSLLFAITPWVVFNARLGYEVTSGYITFALGCLLVWNKLKKSEISILGFLILSISTYIAHTQRYLTPLFILLVLIIFRNSIFKLKNKKTLIITFIVLLLTQIPNIYLTTTNAFWVKNMATDYANINVQLSDFINQYLTYISPKSMFGQSSDINLQHTIPSISLLYSWLIIPFFIGIYQLYKNRNTNDVKYLFLLYITAPIPGALSGHFISIQRVLSLIIPIILIITLGLDYIIQKFKYKKVLPIFTILIIFSLLMLWRSYFVFFPQQRAITWNYGYQQLAKIIQDNPQNKYLIDDSGSGPYYINLLYFLRYPPQEFQKLFTEEFLNSYYDNPPYNSEYKFANVDIRPLYWRQDIYLDQIIVGGPLTISQSHVTEHFLEKVFEIKDPMGVPVLIGYKTNPIKKLSSEKKIK